MIVASVSFMTRYVPAVHVRLSCDNMIAVPNEVEEKEEDRGEEEEEAGE